MPPAPPSHAPVHCPGRDPVRYEFWDEGCARHQDSEEDTVDPKGPPPLHRLIRPLRHGLGCGHWEELPKRRAGLVPGVLVIQPPRLGGRRAVGRHLDPRLAQLPGDRLAPAVEEVLGGHVCGEEGPVGEPGDGGNVENVPVPPLLHPRDKKVGEGNVGLDVNIDAAELVVEGQVEEGLLAAKPRVIAEAVNHYALPLQVGDDVLGGGVEGEVVGESGGLDAMRCLKLPRSLLQRTLGTRHQYQIVAVRGEDLAQG
mmetsp:Transcript_41185/g.131810  ORF Transcript_41185/g.131810 Transcript_41185/m.131810 type:complete len:255 (+) Transcript_41185:138-902(+)